MESEKVKVFISYAREDSEAAQRLYDDLRAAGLDPWLDKETIRPGEDWRVAIRHGVRESHFFLALLSSTSVAKRGMVQKEFKLALDTLDEFPEGEIFVIPLRLDECEPSHERFRNLQWADMFPDWQEGLRRILWTILGDDQRDDSEFFKPDTVPRFTCRQWVSESRPQEGEEVQVRLLITNESQIEARNVHISIQLPLGYVGVDPHYDLDHHEDIVGSYGHFSLVRVMRATVEHANPMVRFTVTYLYGEDDRPGEQPIQEALRAHGGESLGDLINQDEIISCLEGWLEALRPRQPLFIQLDGELGVGKTRVLQHAVKVARQIGYHVFHDIRPHGRDPNFPDPLPSMLKRGLCKVAPNAKLDQLVRSIAGCTDHTMVAAVTTYLGHPIPDTSDRWNPLGPEGRNQCIARFIVKFSHYYKPVFIVVDDLDRTPDSTLKLLRCIADEAEVDLHHSVRIGDDPQPRGVRILVTLNSKAKDPPTKLIRELKAITGRHGLWSVPCLKTDDTQELIKQTYNRLPPPGWAEELHRLCQGNPLLVLEVLRLLERKGKLRLCQGRWEFADEPLKLLLDQVLQHEEETTTIYDIVKTRLPDPHEDENSYRFLQVIAVLGRELKFEKDMRKFICKNAKLSEDDFEQAEERLRCLGVLTETAEGLWTITPPILYEAVMDSLSASKSRLYRLHESAAEYLKVKYKGQGEWAAKIAHHFHQAGQPAEAFGYLLKAAKWEESRKDFWRTVGLYEWALEDWPKERPPEEEVELRLSLANLYETLGDYELAEKHLAEAYSVFERAEDSPQGALGRAQVRIQQGWMAHLRQSDHQALEIYELAQEELDSLSKPHPSQLQRKLWRYHGVSAILTGQLEKGHQLIMQALDEARRENDYNELANIYLDVGLSYFKREMWEEALEQYDLGEKALKQFEKIDDLKVKAKLVASKAAVHLRQYKDEQALAEYEEAIRMAREITYPDVEAEASLGLGVLYKERGVSCQRRGDLDQAICHWDQAVRYLTYSARTYGRLKKLERTEAAYEELLKPLFLAERWDELLYEAAYANRLHALSDTGHGYAADAQYTLLRSGRSFTEYPDLFGNAPNEPPDLLKGG